MYDKMKAMAKKKTISENDIISWYMQHVLEYNENPKSVFAFAKSNNFEESKFYMHFASFEAIEKRVFKAFFDNTMVMLIKSEEYQSFDARNKLLSFYFTFFENLTANRSYVLYALDQNKYRMNSLSILSELKQGFTDYITALDIETLDIKQEQIDKIQKRALRESAWLQFLSILKFWKKDISPSFEKTDIFIEKSINTSFDILNITPLKSVIDFGKFIVREGMQMSKKM